MEEGESYCTLAQISKHNFKNKQKIPIEIQLQMWSEHSEARHQGGRRAECQQGRGWMAGRPFQFIVICQDILWWHSSQ